MRRLRIRVLALLLCLCAISLGPREAAGEMVPELSLEAWPELDARFGLPVEDITRDEAGEPVLVKGHPFRTVKGAYFDKGQGSAYGFDVDFMDYPFWEASTHYDGNLAVMSLAMALSASRPAATAGEEEDPSLNLRRFLTEAGFGDIRQDDYGKVPSMYTVSTAMGSRVMEAPGQDPFILIAVGVCGSNYQNEWQSNLSPGDGSLHEGFQGASQLVLDRLAGYIAARGIHGRVKVWISGFSRAAAVANLTAAALTNTGWLRQEDVYAYTFATPAAVKDPPAEGYGHIWNVICPTDPVPQVMPADWGFGRFGTDCYLPVPEYSSVIGAMVTWDRADLDKEAYGVVNNYSPELNLRIRLLISLLLDVVESREHFNETFQPALVGIMQDKTLPNTLTTLRKLMLEVKDTSHDRRVNVDELMDYLIRVFSGSITRTGLGANGSNSAKTLYRLFNEHNENSYLANVGAIRNGYFEETETAHVVMVRGPVTVALSVCLDEATIPLLSMASDGIKKDPLAENGQEALDIASMYCAERSGDTTVITVPGDNPYLLTWTAERDGTVEIVQAEFGVRATALYTGAATGPIRVRAGDTGVALQLTEGVNRRPEGFAEQTFDSRELAQFMGIASLGINWRVALTAIFALAALAVCAVLCLFASRKPSRRKQYGAITWLVLCLFGVAALETEGAFWFFADMPLLRLAWKAAVALCLVYLFFRVHPPEGGLLKSLFPAILLACGADLVISLSFVAGVALFALFHLTLILWMRRTTPMSRGRWIQWLAVAVPLAALIVLLFGASHGALAWAVAAYSAVLLLTVFVSAGQTLRIRCSALLLPVSDALLGIFATVMANPAIHALYMLLFYAGLLLLAVCDEGAGREEED